MLLQQTNHIKEGNLSYQGSKLYPTVTDVMIVCSPEKEDRSVITADGGGFSFILPHHFYAVISFQYNKLCSFSYTA